MKTITLPYSPAITHERLMEILQREYPGKKVWKFLNHLRISENAVRVAQVFVTHFPKQNLTKITINATAPIWFGVAILFCWPVALGLFLYCYLGNWATEITEKLKIQLESCPQIDNPNVAPRPEEPQFEAYNPGTNSSAQYQNIDFSKFGNSNTNY